MYTGHSKLILKYLGFLRDEYSLSYCFQSFDNYNGFCGPVDTYSFYNNNGCITLHHIVQKGDIEVFTAKQFSKTQEELLETRVDLALYIAVPCWRLRTLLRRLSQSIRSQVSISESVFGVDIDR